MAGNVWSGRCHHGQSRPRNFAMDHLLRDNDCAYRAVRPFLNESDGDDECYNTVCDLSSRPGALLTGLDSSLSSA